MPEGTINPEHVPDPRHFHSLVREMGGTVYKRYFTLPDHLYADDPHATTGNKNVFDDKATDHDYERGKH